MNSLKERTKNLQSITLDSAENSREGVIHVKFKGIDIKSVLISLDNLTFNAENPKKSPEIDFMLTDLDE